LKQWSKEGRQYDVVMLDPPAFTKSRETIQKAITGYKEINLRGMKLVRPGGFLVTSSCTNLVSPELFLQIIDMAAKDTRRKIRQVVFQTQSADHPIIRALRIHNTLNFSLFKYNKNSEINNAICFEGDYLETWNLPDSIIFPFRFLT
jgi:23S rRNA (cytosine1962-C5)-methyltransferase